MRYDVLYKSAAQRAVDSGLIDIKAMIEQLTAAGMSVDAIEKQVMTDLETGGPLFGRFFRAIEGAASGAVGAAYTQGVSAGELIASDADLAAALEEYDRMQDLAEGDPEVLQEVEAQGDLKTYQWIATLENTCHLCLPLHGKVDTLRGWRERGLHPDTIHSTGGTPWTQRCKCALVLAEGEKNAVNREVAPLVRNKDISGIKGGRRTARSVAQFDIDRAIAAVDRARQTPEGRRTLARLGQTKG